MQSCLNFAQQYAEIHTDATIAKVDQLRIELQEMLKVKLKQARGEKNLDWKLLKFSSLRKFSHAIKEVACYTYTCTSHQEAFHKQLKPGAQHTNNRKATRGNQMSNHATYAAGIRRVLDATEEEPVGRNSMVRIVLCTYWYLKKANSTPIILIIDLPKHFFFLFQLCRASELLCLESWSSLHVLLLYNLQT